MSEERHINQKSIDLIKSFEGLYLDAYKCSADVWTIGYGHTGMTHNDGTVHKGRTITEERAEELLAYDMQYFEKVVQRLVTVEVNDDMFGALVSFAFNCGEGNLKKSTLLRKLNEGDYDGAAEQFIRWNKAGGKTLNGLTRRRASEERLFQGIGEPYIATVDEMGELGYPVV
jgi:GH24 family phage-related lysozyme (muramidase)